MSRFIYIVAGALLCVMLSLTACGRKGPLEAPPGTQPHGGQSSSSGPPDRPFVLDGLVR